MSIDGEGRQHLVSGIRVGRHWNGVCPGAIHESLIDELTPSLGAVTGAIRINQVDDSLTISRGGGAELSSAGAQAACWQPDFFLGIETGSEQAALGDALSGANLRGEEDPGAAIGSGHDLRHPLFPDAVGAPNAVVVDSEHVVCRL